MPRTNNKRMKATEFISMLNKVQAEQNMFLASTAGHYSAITDEDGTRYFINKKRTPEQVINGVVHYKKDAKGFDVYSYTLGTAMTAKA